MELEWITWGLACSVSLCAKATPHHWLNFDLSLTTAAFRQPLSHPTKWHPQQPEARSRRRSGPRARVRDDTRTTSTAPFRLRRSDCAQRAPTLLNSDTRHARRDQGESCADSSVVKDKAQHAVVLDKNVTDKLNKDVQSYRLITVATLVDRLKINGSLARKALNDLEANGQIKKVVGHSKLCVYSMSTPRAGERRNCEASRICRSSY